MYVSHYPLCLATSVFVTVYTYLHALIDTDADELSTTKPAVYEQLRRYAYHALQVEYAQQHDGEIAAFTEEDIHPTQVQHGLLLVYTIVSYICTCSCCKCIMLL